MSTRTGTKSVLIVMDDTGVSAAVRKVLCDEGLMADLASNEALAEATLISAEFDLIICEPFAPASLEGTTRLTRQLRSQSSAPIILIVDESQLETNQFEADFLIPKPFGREALLSAVAQASEFARRPAKNHVRKVRPPKVSEVQHLEEVSGEFCKIGINDVLTAGFAPHDIFVKLRAGKFVRVNKQGEEISFERICSYQQKGIEYLYVRKEDHRQQVISLLEWHELHAFSPLARDGGRHALLERTFAELLSKAALRGVKRTDFDWARMFLENMLIVTSDCDQVFGLLGDLENSDGSLLQHSLAVSLYSLLVAREMAWTTPDVLLKVALAGVFHDVGLTGTSQEFVYKPDRELTDDSRAAVDSHVARGIQLLLQIPGLPDEIIKMVEHHHHDGPHLSSLSECRKLGINPMSRVIAVVDDFCCLALSPASKGETRPTPGEVLKAMSEEPRGKFEARLIAALKKVFQVEEDHVLFSA